jgi:peptidoglycan/LPS O-acetylase OafA/YrhL
MTSNKYRPDIDGLRAVSILGVLLYHANLGLPGGFIGVDVFFVISGFLIGRIVLNDLQSNRFSLIEFWAKRIRRILPAVSFVVAATLIAGYFLLIPADYSNLSRSAVAQSLLSANIFFFRNAGDYFSQSAEFKPLLHTWTLSLEEQFYILFPLVCAFLYKFNKKTIGVGLFILALISFLLGISLIDSHPQHCFYLLPTRAWELISGTLLAIYLPRYPIARKIGDALTTIGLLAIMSAMLFFDSEINFPGAWTLVPVFGAMAIITGGNSAKGVASRVLRSKTFVFIGVISYSLYLWHWPLFAFSKTVFLDISTTFSIILCIASIGLAYLSWRFIENPFRHSKLLANRRIAFIFASFATAFVVLPSEFIKYNNGYEARFSSDHLSLIEDVTWSGNERASLNAQPLPMGEMMTITNESVPDFVLWGDSHGMMLSNTINKLANEYEINGESFLVSSQLPVTNLFRPSWGKEFKDERLKNNKKILDSLISRQVPNVILVGRWSAACDNEKFLVTDNHSIDSDANNLSLASSSLKRQLNSMLKTLSDAKVRVWIIKQVPENNDEWLSRRVLNAELFSFLKSPPKFTIAYSDYLQGRLNSSNIMDGIDVSGVTVLDSAPDFFNNPNRRLNVHNYRSFYRDDHHLTKFGAEQMVRPILESIFAEIAKDK